MADTTDFTVERDAKLFEAGNYEDKGMNVSEDDLDLMAAGTGEAPIRIEHGDSPFDGALGVLKSAYRKGRELFGKLAFTDDAWAFLKTLPHRKLSLGIRKDKSGIAEVSLVREPRIADARVFSEGVVGFSAELDAEEAVVAPPVPEPTPKQEVATMAETNTEVVTTEDPLAQFTNAQLIDYIRRNMPDKSNKDAILDYAKNTQAVIREGRDELLDIARMTAANNKELKTLRMESSLTNLQRDGKLTPAMVPFARALLSSMPLPSDVARPEELVTFTVEKDGEKKEATAHFAEVVFAMFQAAPQLFSTREMLEAQSAEEGVSEAEFAAARKVDPTMTRERMVKANSKGVN